MEIIERNGRYYMKLLNGELEISAQQAASMVAERGAVIRNNLKNWMDNFSYSQWTATHIPANADEFIKADAFFNDIIMQLDEIYRAHSNEQTAHEMLDFCYKKIEGLQQVRHKARNPHFIDYEITCWNRVIAFLHGMTGM